MAPIVAVALRWFVGGIAMSIGWEVGKKIFEKANEDGWITKGLEETKADIKKTWTGRYGEDQPKEKDCCGGTSPDCCVNH
jgi:hypothetical protein